jgi:hypothetical protein
VTPPQAWLRGGRAVHEITGIIDPYELRRAFYDAVEKYLGPAIGMSARERWELHTTDLEREILVEALEERSAIMYEGKKQHGTRTD